MSKWAQRFIQMAEHVSQWSKDPSTRCGAVIVGDDNEVLATGYNGFPRGVEEEETYCVTDGTQVYVGDNDHDPENSGWIDNVWEATRLNKRWERPEKYEWVEHAERNAIYNAARSGVRTKGATMYLNYAVECCAGCTRAIIQSGIRRVVGPRRPFPGSGKGTHYSKTSANHVMMSEAGIEVENIDADVYLEE
jgi:dCMP deaminase